MKEPINENLSELLSQAISEYAILGGKPLVKKVAKHLATTSHCEVLNISNNISFQDICNILYSWGKILKIQDNIVLALVGSGMCNMNPTVIAVQFDNTHINSVAIAKEGLIKQKSALKALQTLKELLHIYS